MKLRIAGILKESVVDGPGIRYVIFTQGCLHNCPGCHNPETHDLNGGYEIDTDEIIRDIDNCHLLSGVTFSGGEPFLQAESLVPLAIEIRKRSLSIVSYSGYTFEELTGSEDRSKRELLESLDTLIDGKFDLSLRDISLKFRGSKNQRIIDVKKSLESKLAVLCK